MKYITRDDLLTGSYEQFITESTRDDWEVINNIESKAIALVKTYLSRYDTDSIFGIILINEEDEDEIDTTPPIHNELLADILTKITLYRLFRRNAARKIPEDIKEDYAWAIKELEKIRNGSTKLDLPPKLDEQGNIVSKSLWGNNTNNDYYI